jgi:hypothetical protein
MTTRVTIMPPSVPPTTGPISAPLRWLEVLGVAEGLVIVAGVVEGAAGSVHRNVLFASA